MPPDSLTKNTGKSIVYSCTLIFCFPTGHLAQLPKEGTMKTRIFGILSVPLVAAAMALLTTACGGGEEYPNKSAEAMPHAEPGNMCVMDSGCASPGSDYTDIRRRNIGVVTPDRHCSVDYPDASACTATAVQNCRTCADGHQLCNWATVDSPPVEACTGF